MSETVSNPPEGYRETYRSQVVAWECDVVEHFTVAYYFEKFERASARFLSDLGLDTAQISSVRHRDFYVRYSRELRAASIFLIRTGIIAHAGNTLHLGHQVVDVLDGEVCTTVEHRLESESLAGLTESSRVEWDGPERDERKVPGSEAGWFGTGTDFVMPADLDLSGRLGLSSCIHLFSAAGGHLMTRFGWTSKYIDDNHIGFSTFEFQLLMSDTPAAGTPIDVQGRLAHVGRSSVHMVHRIIHPRTGQTYAVLHQLGVQLDKNARRPSAIADHIRDAANASMAL